MSTKALTQSTRIFNERISITLVDGHSPAGDSADSPVGDKATGAIVGAIAGAIADVRLIRADKLNALDSAMFAALVDVGDWLTQATSVRAVILSGDGRGFCAGLDMANFTDSGIASNPTRDSKPPQEKSTGESKANHNPPPLSSRTHGNANLYQHVAMLWRRLPMPVIAAIHGVCFGGGLQIASGADIRITAPDARLAIMEMRWGLVPDMGGFALWRSLVRDDILRELTYSNREFCGEEAHRLGFATYVDSQPYARALAIATTIVHRNPEAMRHVKQISNRLPDMNESSILLAESKAQAEVIRSFNQIEAVRAQIEKRLPIFRD